MRQSLLLRRFPFAVILLTAGCARDLPTRPAAVPSGPSRSTFVNVSTVLGAGGALFGVNNSGLMVGFNPVSGVPRAFAYSTATGAVKLKMLDSLKALPARDTAFAVNRVGEIVGTSTNAAGASRPVRWLTTSSAPGDLGTAGPGYALDINNSGTIVGWWSNAGVARAFVKTAGGGLVDPLGGLSGKARAVNDTGMVVGEVTTGGQLRAFRWTSGGGLHVLGTLGGTMSVANDVSYTGRIVGASTTSGGQTHAFIWYPGYDRMDDLGTLGGTESVATAITNVVVVGHGTTASGARHGFVWHSRTRSMRDQGSDGGVLARIHGLNRFGLAVGTAQNAAGASSRVYWQLTEVDTNPVVFFTAPPPTVDEGVPLTFSYDAVDDEDALRYLWTFGNGAVNFTYPAEPPLVSRTYQDNGVYNVRVIVIDPSGVADTATTTVTVVNRPPTGTLVTPAGPLPWQSTFTISVNNISDAPADLAAKIQASFNCGNGVWSAYALTYTRSCAAPGNQASVTVGVRLRDKDGAVTEYTRTLTVLLQPIVTVSAVGSTSVTLGQTFTAKGSFIAPGLSQAPYTFRYIWDDGRQTSGVLNAQGAVPPVQHTYIAVGTYHPLLTVTDSHGVTGQSAAFSVTVHP